MQDSLGNELLTSEEGGAIGQIAIGIFYRQFGGFAHLEEYVAESWGKNNSR